MMKLAVAAGLILACGRSAHGLRMRPTQDLDDEDEHSMGFDGYGDMDEFDGYGDIGGFGGLGGLGGGYGEEDALAALLEVRATVSKIPQILEPLPPSLSLSLSRAPPPPTRPGPDPTRPDPTRPACAGSGWCPRGVPLRVRATRGMAGVWREWIIFRSVWESQS